MGNSDLNDRLLVLVDGSSFLYRAFHAMPPLTNSRGEPTGAVYGVVNMLKRLVSEYPPDLLAVIFDAPGKTFRDELFEAYKQHRPPMPDDMRPQIEPLFDLIKALGFPLMQVSGVEADDVMGALAQQADKLGCRVYIATGDKDLAQLVNERISLINASDGSLLDCQGVVDKFGVPPERIIDYLALMGDKVDNIPGVPGVGPKTAVKWLSEYGSFAGVIENAEKVGGKIGEKLRAALPDLPRSYELATIRCDLDLELAPGDLVLQAPDTDSLKALYERLEFKTWRSELDSPAATLNKPIKQLVSPKSEPGSGTDYELVLTEDRLNYWIGKIHESELFAFDTETTSLEYMKAEVVGLSISVEPGKAAYVPLAHDYLGVPEQLGREKVFKALREILEDPDRAKVGHHLKYDCNVLANHGIELKGIRHDSMIESYVLNSTASRHDMDTLALGHLGHTTIHYEDVAGKGARQIRFDQVELDKACAYAAEDADITLRLHQKFWGELSSLPAQKALYEDIEIPLIGVLSRLERNGVFVDVDKLADQGKEFVGRIAALEKQAHEMAGEVFNLGSPKQIQELLYEKQKLPVRRKTPKGQPSTAEDVLQELALDYPLPRLILEYRGLVKLKSTYIDKLPLQVNARTGRIHTSYHQAVASTGRLSSADPNLQNIPVRTDEGRRIRDAFVAPEGYVLLSCDYSQIELRIMAHLSRDTGLVRAFENGLDVHRATAAEVFGVKTEAVSSDQRRAAKAINFGLIYGMSAFGLARQLGIERGAAQSYVDKYFERYPGVKVYMDSTREVARQQGYVETVYGRRLYLPDINARNAQLRQYAERTAINAPMQGTAADIIKRAMIATDYWLTEQSVPARMIMQVHDELVFEVEKSAIDEVKKTVCKLMEAAASLSVPLLAEAGTGASWGDAH